ncbi:MAG: hypothetical protein ACRDG2_04560, partial [Actinomycetota bacterium]
MRRAIIWTFVVLLAGLPAAPALAQGDDEFTFFGSGFGHGLGMSQWGAYGLAQEGWTASRILRHFYSGTRVDRAAAPAQLRIGLTQGRDSIQLEAQAGDVEIRDGDQRGTVVATIPSGETWRVRPTESGYRII